MTRAPFDAHCVAAASPIPLLAPVTQTVFGFSSDVNVSVFRILLDECPPRGYFVAHQHGEHVVRSCSIFNGDLSQRSVLGVQGRIPKLLCIHFTETLVALNPDSGIAA